MGIVGGACSDVEQTIIEVDKFAKRERLLDLLRATGTAPFPMPNLFSVRYDSLPVLPV